MLNRNFEINIDRFFMY